MNQRCLRTGSASPRHDVCLSIAQSRKLKDETAKSGQVDWSATELTMYTPWPTATSALPEKTLLVAILVRAALDAYGVISAEEADSKTRIRAEAVAWFASDRYKPGSFCWICDHLNISFRALRRTVFASDSIYNPERYARPTKNLEALKTL
jgi:hypothetical protein